MIFRRGGNVGPEEEAIRSQQGQWPHPQVVSSSTCSFQPSCLLNFGYRHWKLLIPARAMAVIKFTMITELPLRCSGDDPWHVQHFSLCLAHHRLWCRLYSSGPSLYPQTINHSSSTKKDQCDLLILHKRLSAI